MIKKIGFLFFLSACISCTVVTEKQISEKNLTNDIIKITEIDSLNKYERSLLDYLATYELDSTGAGNLLNYVVKNKYTYTQLFSELNTEIYNYNSLIETKDSLNELMNAKCWDIQKRINYQDSLKRRIDAVLDATLLVAWNTPIDTKRDIELKSRFSNKSDKTIAQIHTNLTLIDENQKRVTLPLDLKTTLTDDLVHSFWIKPIKDSVSYNKIVRLSLPLSDGEFFIYKLIFEDGSRIELDGDMLYNSQFRNRKLHKNTIYTIDCPYLERNDVLLKRMRKINIDFLKELSDTKSAFKNFYITEFNLLPGE